MHLRRIQHGVVDSTSERAFADIATGMARHGDVHLATAQTAGRGRLGRSWSSPPGEGLYLSLVLLPPPPPWNPAGLTMAAGLAMLDAAGALGLGGARLKWPNDLVAGEEKVAGVLVETRGLDPGRPHYVVGLGLNVRQRDFPTDLRAERPVASLALLGLDVSIERAREEVLAALVLRIELLPRDHVRLAADFLRATGLEGSRVRVRVGDEEHEGELEDLSLSDGLCLRGRDGRALSFPLEIVRSLAPSL
jgi:BirA family biotin operon repressor/biotin-[acetyl-CoA-carboxylase] ligase